MTKPKRDTVGSLRQEVEQLEKQIRKIYQEKSLLEESLALAHDEIRCLRDDEQVWSQALENETWH